MKSGVMPVASMALTMANQSQGWPTHSLKPVGLPPESYETQVADDGVVAQDGAFGLPHIENTQAQQRGKQQRRLRASASVKRFSNGPMPLSAKAV